MKGSGSRDVLAAVVEGIGGVDVEIDAMDALCCGMLLRQVGRTL